LTQIIAWATGKAILRKQGDKAMVSGLPVFDKTIQETNLWLKELMDRLEINDRQMAYALLRATLHAVRDRIGPQSACHLGAQLPMLLRGVFYEGWRLARVATKERHVESFVDHVLQEVPLEKIGDPEAAVSAALAVIRSHVDPGEALKIIDLFPDELKRFWLQA
jgi:uncharacterized protein (DUF2267 family)